MNAPPMKPRVKSHTALSVTRSKAKMYEYNVPVDEHITIYEDPSSLFDLTIGILGDFSNQIDFDTDNEKFKSLKYSLRFSSYFFDAYLKARLNPEIDDYILLLGASAYFLCDLPGSSRVLAKDLPKENNNPSCSGFDNFIIWLLHGDFSTKLFFPENKYNALVREICRILNLFQLSGSMADLQSASNKLKKIALDVGTDRELLLSDVAISLIRKRISMSTWVCLPEYTGLSRQEWSATIPNLKIKELWPAQRVIGEKGVYKGLSGIIQMPTSAGKTKATELILRSAFLSNRVTLAVIVAPFRALCSEIHDDLEEVFSGENISIDKVSDSIQMDIMLDEVLGHKQILIVTPEKLDFIIRNEPSLSEYIKLLIYDEGHLFDDSSRGVKYELLLASLKEKISKETQVVLISAVISNTSQIKEWLLDENATVISGTDLIPTYRTIAFTSWRDRQLHFVSPEKPDTQVFFVPRVLNQIQLDLRSKREKPKPFPIKDDGNDIAIFLGLKLVPQGAVAIYTAKKISTSKIINRVLEIFERGYNEIIPTIVSNQNEINRLNYIYKLNFGSDYEGTIASSMGIFSHHGDVPQGIRLSIEFALQRELIKFVVCTSTLAQGVNLPLRYLIVSNTRYSLEKIKTRDFHNLLGRAGRAGMYTEGSIIFANPELWDEKNWKWNEALALLDFNNSEPCLSYLSILFQPLSDHRNKQRIELDIYNLVTVYLNDFERIEELVEDFAKKYGSKDLPENEIKSQFRQRFYTISTIESYLLANLDVSDEEFENKVRNLTKGTLAYNQLEENNKSILIDIFLLIANKIKELEPSSEKRIIYSRTFQGIHDSIELSKWASLNREVIKTISNFDEFIEVFWPLFSKFISNSEFRKIKSDGNKRACSKWMHGIAFKDIFSSISHLKVGTYKMKMEHVVSLCESGYSYDGALMVGAITQLLKLERDKELSDSLEILNLFQKNLKYGLPSQESIVLYELGFSDRMLAQELAPLFSEVTAFKREFIDHLKSDQKEVLGILNNYPSYFSNRFDIIISESELPS